MTALATRSVAPPTSEPSVPPRRWGPAAARWEVVGVAAAVLVTIVIGLVLIAQGAPLGHDESVYALRGRYYAEGGPSSAWANYRAEGLPVVFAAVWPFLRTEPALRGIVLLSGCALVVLTWMLGRQFMDRRAAVLAAGLLAVTPGLLAYTWQISLDVPSAALGMAAAAVLAAATADGRLSGLAWAAVPIAAVATFVRYGAPVVVASGMTAVAVARWSTFWAERRRVVPLAAATLAAMLVVLVVPPVTNSTRAPGDAFRVRQVRKELSPFASWGDFAGHVPSLLGWAVGIAVVVGLVAAIVLAARREPLRRGLVMPVVGAVVFWVVLNVGLAQGFGQYLLPIWPFVLLVAATGLVWLAERTPRLLVATLGVTLLLAGPVVGFLSAAAVPAGFQDAYGVIRATSRAIGEDAASGPCVVLTSYSPQVAWYSGCSSRAIAPELMVGGDADRDVLLAQAAQRYAADLPPDAPVYAVFFNRGKRQPTAEVIEQILQVGPVTTFGDAADGRVQEGRYVRVGTLRDAPEVPE